MSDVRIFGGWDWSLNFQYRGDSNPRWYGHRYMLAVAPRSLLDQTFEGKFPATPEVPRPLHIKKVCCIPGAVSYAIKSQFYRRIGYTSANGRKGTVQNVLQPDEKRELAVMLDELGIHARFILRGFKILNGRLVDA